MVSHDIVKEIRRKGSSDFEPAVHLGTEQRFVAPLLNSNNNNLEEQSLLGIDCITEEYETTKEVSGNTINIIVTTKDFYNNTNVPNKYYRLEIETIKEPVLTSNYQTIKTENLYFVTIEDSTTNKVQISQKITQQRKVTVDTVDHIYTSEIIYQNSTP